MSDFPPTWTADNGNGTFTNPLFYEEFSDPDLIRVGDDYYLTGTTMHTMPGLPVLHSSDLVNWRLLTYACPRLDLGPEFRLEGGREVYGQGFWAPCLRFHAGTFWLFSNVNGHGTQVFRAADPAGPWTHTPMEAGLHDLSVLFDDDGRIFVVWGYRNLQIAQLRGDLGGLIPGTQRELFPPDSLMGEGAHFYKIDGRYYITSAWYEGRMRMACARADRPEGPYEINPAISIGEDFGLSAPRRLISDRFRPPFQIESPSAGDPGKRGLHQGGLVGTPSGEWWGFAMMDYTALGRVTCLSPVTWQDGWPFFGLPGNLGRAPRLWVKPDTGRTAAPAAPFARTDDFDATALQPLWQWNHAPDDARWSLTARPGYLRLHSLPAPDFWSARNTLTQRAVGPVSRPSAVLDAAGMQPGDVAGLALLNLPYAWIGVRCTGDGLRLELHDQRTVAAASRPLERPVVRLQAECDFLAETATFRWSGDGEVFQEIGPPFPLVFQLKTFQGVRYGLFHFNADGRDGGWADFDGLTVEEPFPRGLRRPIPVGQEVTIAFPAAGTVLGVEGLQVLAVPPDDPRATRFVVRDCGRGRVALQAGEGFVSVQASGTRGQILLRTGRATEREMFQWVETPMGELLLLSLASHRYLAAGLREIRVCADDPGPNAGGADACRLRWESPCSPD